MSESAAQFGGRTIELEGTLTGVLRNDDGVTLMLSTNQFGSLNLKIKSAPDWVEAGQQARILAIIPKATEGSVTVGIPDLMVVAIASAYDVRAAEQQARNEAAHRAAVADARSLAKQSVRSGHSAASGHVAARHNAGRTTTQLASRGGQSSSAVAMASAFSHYLSPSAQRIYPAYVGFVQRWNPRLTDHDADAIASSILVYSEHYRVDPRLVVSLIIAESDFHLGETSNKGAMGLGQLMPDEVHDMRLTNPYDPIQNIAGAVYLLRGRLDHYATGPGLSMQQIILALASYNAGMGAVKKYGGVPPYKETQNYVRKIQRIYEQLCAGDASTG